MVLLKNYEQSNSFSSEKGTFMIEEQLFDDPDTKKVRKFMLGRMLGRGGFAKCYEITNFETKKLSAVKIISKKSLSKPGAPRKILSEISIHKILDHENVVKFEHFFEDKANIYIIIEKCPNQTLHELIKRRKKLHEIEVRLLALQILAGIKYLHANNIIHRDLKLGNLFLSSDMQVKIGDFGLAARLEREDQLRYTICGTPNYVAPEILNKNIGHSFQVDIWAFGVILYILLAGKPPFEYPEVKDTYKNIQKKNYSFPPDIEISDNAKSLINSILIVDPTQRLTLDDILLHPFLNSGYNKVLTYLPKYTLVCPLSSIFIKKYTIQNEKIKVFESENATTGITGKKLEREEQSGKIPKQSLIIPIPSNIMEENGNTILGVELPHIKDHQLKSQISKKILSNSNTGKEEWKKSKFSIQEDLFLETRFAEIGTSQTKVKNSSILSKTLKGNIEKVSFDNIFMKHYANLTEKYGMAYDLTNGIYGIIFNDSTTMQMQKLGMSFLYIFRDPNDLDDKIETYSLQNFPNELKNKLKILKHVIEKIDALNANSNRIDDIPYKTSMTGIYIQKWVKFKQSYMFRLSNKIIQFKFFDSTELLLNFNDKSITFYDIKREKLKFLFKNSGSLDNTEIIKRLKYAKDILSKCK